jgi:hypothetical protein
MVIVEEGYRTTQPVENELYRSKYYEVAETNDCDNGIEGLSVGRGHGSHVIRTNQMPYVSSFAVDPCYIDDRTLSAK